MGAQAPVVYRVRQVAGTTTRTRTIRMTREAAFGMGTLCTTGDRSTSAGSS